VSAAYRLTGVTFRHSADGGPAQMEGEGLAVPHLELAAGTVTALTGPNGAGKTTLLHLLAFLLEPTTGSIAFFDGTVKPGTPAEAAARRRVGLVPQNPYLLNGTVADNVALGLRIRKVPRPVARERVMEALERFGLGHLSARPARALSGGEAQKVAIARTLVLEPEVLLLDEPFTHLDRPYLEQLERLVGDLCRKGGRTVVFTSHDRARAQAAADRVCGLVGGRLVPASLLNLFHGRLDRGSGVFDTGRLRVRVASDCPDGSHLAVEPTQLVLSASPLASSMQNTFAGRITGLGEAGGRVRVRVEAGEPFEAEVTPESAADQGLRLGMEVWVSFKSTGMTIF
jgi:tungstate transport system ATP-binding protein